MSSLLVTGVGGPAGRSVITMLLARQHRVVGADMRLINAEGIQFYQIPVADSPDLLSKVYSIAVKEQVDWIIPTVSEELPVFARGWQWEDEFPVLVSKARAVEIANDKYLTAKTLASWNVSVPRFVLPSQVHSPEEVALKIGWPCISKPRIGRGGREVSLRKVEDWPLVSTMSDRYILQEFAPGTDYAPNVYIGPNGKNVVIVLEKTELKEGIVGNASKVQRVDEMDVANLALAAARAIGLSGPLDIDIRRRTDGNPTVLEINARFGANIQHAPEVMDAVLDGILSAA
jgi:carbamoylphosphate synthase large subunit